MDMNVVASYPVARIEYTLNGVPDDILRISLRGMVFNVPDNEAVRIAPASRSYELSGAELQVAGMYIIADKRENE
jgi:hypothetical protein